MKDEDVENILLICLTVTLLLLVSSYSEWPRGNK